MYEKRLYIIITYDLHVVGGSQMYIAGITEFLENHGYEVLCLFPGENYGNSEIPSLQKHIKGGVVFLGNLPQSLPIEIVKAVCDNARSLMRHDVCEYEHIYIESNDDKFALWGEILAREFFGIHICHPINEIFDADSKCYRTYMNFWLWKFYRHEVYSLPKLYEGYIDTNEEWEEYRGWCVEKEPIENVNYGIVESIVRVQYTIAYIGRGNKEYVSEMISEIGKFAKKYLKLQIQVIFIGDMSDKEHEICTRLCRLPNVKVLILGNLVPIPKAIFNKVDVVLANSQTAYFSAYEGKPVIVMDSATYKSLGIMGYDYFWGDRDSINEIPGDYVTTIAEAIENVLVNKQYVGKKIRLKDKKELKDIYKLAIDAFSRSENDNKKDYYIVESLSGEKKRINDFYNLKRIIKDNSTIDYALLKKNRVAVFGAGNEGAWTIRWMKENGIAPSIVVDNNSDKWDKYLEGNHISSPEMLKERADLVVVASVNYINEIKHQIATYGFNNSKCITSEYIRNWSAVQMLAPVFSKEEREEIELATDLLDLYGFTEQIKKYKKIYIYGAGFVGQFVYDYLTKIGLENRIKAFYVSNDETRAIKGVPVKIISSRSLADDEIVLVAAKRAFRKEMLLNCKQLGIDNYIEIDVLDDRDYEYYSSIDESAYPLELKAWYKKQTGRSLNLNNPKTFNEKINWMKLYDRNPRKTEYADKYKVRNYVEKTIGREYLIPLLGVWNDFDEIEFDDLPDTFVLKCNHGCGWNLLVDNKDEIDFDNVRQRFNKWMNTNYAYVSGFELQYMNIVPQIIAEELIKEKCGVNLKDYKFFVFDGVVRVIQVDIDRFSEHLRNYYSPRWEYIPVSVLCPNNQEKKEPRPNNLEKMILIAEKLGQGFKHVRVDLYDVDERIYFGEMTFTHGSGQEIFSSKEFELQLGRWIC